MRADVIPRVELTTHLPLCSLLAGDARVVMCAFAFVQIELYESAQLVKHLEKPLARAEEISDGVWLS